MSSNNNSVEAMIDNIVTVVFRIHFYYITDKDLEQDLKQEGYLKAYELLSQGNYDPTKNLRTFIYTGVRNAMSNYMYHANKESHMSTEVAFDPVWQKAKNIDVESNNFWDGKLYYNNEDIETDYSVDLNLVSNICNKYKMFGDYRASVLRELKTLGVYSGPLVRVTIDENNFITKSIIGEILWNTLK